MSVNMWGFADIEDRRLGLVCPECGKGYMASCMVWDPDGIYGKCARRCKLCGHQEDMRAEDVQIDS